MLQKLEIIRKEVFHRNPYWDYRKDRYIKPDGSEGDYYYASTPGSVFIVPKLDVDTYILIKQFRVLNNKESIEFPGGGIKKGTTPEESALDELREETGYTCKKLDLLGRHNPCNGLVDEICNVYIANELKYIGEKPDPSEAFEMLKLSKPEINQYIREGRIWDGMTMAAWCLYILKD